MHHQQSLLLSRIMDRVSPIRKLPYLGISHKILSPGTTGSALRTENEPCMHCR